MFSRFEGAIARGWRRPLALGTALVAAAGLGAGFSMAAQASGGPSTTDVQFVPLATPFKLFTAHAFAANASLSSVVIGGSTTVPTNATTVALTVEAGGSGAGVLNFFPAGNSGGGSGQSLSWSAGQTASATIEENVGTKDELTFALSGPAAKATAAIVGYSTQVTDGDISGLDGTAGQVLTNNGSGGTSWQSPPKKTTYTNTVSGIVLNNSFTTVDSVTVPAGIYDVSDTLQASSSVPDFAVCAIATANSQSQEYGANLNDELGTIADYEGSSAWNVVVDAATSEPIKLDCRTGFDGATSANVQTETLVATSVDAVSGPTLR